MCILCVIQKWSRRVATMLPWLVIPLIGLWALSQLLPPAFRFEITSPRLACVFVLLVTLFWYEILMPQLSAWRLRRNAMLREKKRFEALELQKLRKTATRKCRNCLTPYRDQNPGGGKFMCSYCGHISKRPVLDLPIPPGLGISNSSIIKDLFGKGGKVLNGKVWSDNGSLCPEWLENGNWVVNGPLPGKPTYPRKSGIGSFGGNSSDQCTTDRSYSGAYFFPRKWLIAFLKSIRWLWRKLFSISSSTEDDSSDAEHKAMLSKRGENGGSCQESRGEKARRKAEEKRLVRLEKELLEEEERKQREDVARLVEERRKLRDEKIEAENRAKSSLIREKDRKEAEKKRQERRKEKDRGSSKSNSDVEEMEKKAGKEHERRRETDKKSESERREPHRTLTDSIKGQNIETGHVIKGISSNNANRGNAGARYFDRVKGSFLSSSKAFTGGSFFGKVSRNPPHLSKEIKYNSTDNFHASINRKEPDRVAGKPVVNGDEKSVSRPHVMSEPQRRTPPKSWHQLFTQAPALPTSSSSSVISRPSVNSPAETQHPPSSSSPTTYDNPINLPSPFILPPFSNGPMCSSPGNPSKKDSVFPLVAEARHDLLPEEPELFEDPCYVPDPVSLLGPVSESLDNFQLDMGNGFIHDELEKPCPVKVPSSLDTSRRSPIESPLSRLRAVDGKPHNHTSFPTSPKAEDMNSFSAVDSNSANEKTWQMWDTYPLGQDGLGLLGALPNWVLPLEQSRSVKKDMVDHTSQRTMASLFTKDDPAASGTFSPGKMFLGNSQIGGACGPSVPVVNDHDPWLQKAFSPPISAAESYFSVKPVEETEKEPAYQGSSRPPAHNSFDPSPAWSKNERAALQGSGEGVGNPSVLKPHLGGLYSPADVQSLWSFE